MMAYPSQTLTRSMLCQLSTTLRDTQSRPVVIQPGIVPGSVVTPLALRCSGLDRCANLKAYKLCAQLSHHKQMTINFNTNITNLR